LRTSSRDEELTGETKENTVTKNYNITLNRLPNMQSVLQYPITRLKSDSKIESMQLISIIYNSAQVMSFLLWAEQDWIQARPCSSRAVLIVGL